MIRRMALHLRPVPALMAVAALLSACAAPQPLPVNPSPSGQAIVIRASGSGTALPLVGMLADAYAETHDGVTFDIREGTNSGGAIKGVVAGTLDLAVANRTLSEDEAKQPLVYHPFARDAVVFAVHEPNRMLNLSTEQVRGVYGGTTTDWQELGASAGPLIVLDRDKDESMRKLVLLGIMGDQSVEARAVVLPSAREMVDALSTTPGALGYSSLALLRVLRPDDVVILNLDDIAPGPDTVAAGTYPWSMTFGLVLGADAPASVTDFVTWVQGAAGQQVIRSYEAIPLAD